jgi:ubiquinone/menaquinone biosynthesis C-methylase UbiE
MTVFSSEDGKWWSMYGKYKSLSYSDLIEHLKLDRKKIKKLKIKLRKGKGENLRCEDLSFKYKKHYFSIVNTGDKSYDEI